MSVAPLPAAINELFVEEFSSGTTSNWVYGTGSYSAAFSTGDGYGVNKVTIPNTTFSNSVLQVWDAAPYATSSSPLRIHSNGALNVYTTSNQIVQLNVDLNIHRPLANIALGKAVTVSSVQDTNPTLTGNMAVDGIVSTASRWASLKQIDPQWITVDLGATKPISMIRINWEGSCGKDYDLQVSTDNSTWTSVVQVRGNSAAALYSYPVYASGRYVRMNGISRLAPTQGYSIYEFEIYSNSTYSMTTDGYPVCRLGLCDATTAGFLSTANNISLRVDPNSSTNNVVLQASGSSGALRDVATFSTSASNLIGDHSYQLQLDYTASTTAPKIRAYIDGLLIGAATLNGSEGIMLGGSGVSQGKAIRVIADIAATATSGLATAEMDNVTVGCFNSGTITLATPTASAPVLQGAVSRAAQGTYGNFDIALNYASGLTPPTVTTVECRSGGVINVVLTFDKSIRALTPTITAGSARIGSIFYNATAKTVTIPLSNVTNAQRLQIKLANITATDGAVLANAYAAFARLIGDSDGNGVVNAADQALVTANTGKNGASIGYSCRTDPDGSGLVDATDLSVVTRLLGTQLP